MWRSLAFALVPLLSVGAEKCLTKDDVAIELVVHHPMRDLSYWTHPTNNFNLPKTLSAYASVLHTNFPGTAATLVGYKDYEGVDNRAGCYRSHIRMDMLRAYDIASTAFRNDPVADLSLANPHQESSLSALALSATRFQDNGMSPGWFAPNGKRRVRILALITDQFPIVGAPSSNDFPLDGTATCMNNAPTPKEFSTILEQQDVYVVVLGQGKGYQWWSGYNFDRVTVVEIPKDKHKYDVWKVPASLLTDAIAKQLCALKITTTTTSTTTTIPPTTRTAPHTTDTTTSASASLRSTKKRRYCLPKHPKHPKA